MLLGAPGVETGLPGPQLRAASLGPFCQGPCSQGQPLTRPTPGQDARECVWDRGWAWGQHVRATLSPEGSPAACPASCGEALASCTHPLQISTGWKPPPPPAHTLAPVLRPLHQSDSAGATLYSVQTPSWSQARGARQAPPPSLLMGKDSC